MSSVTLPGAGGTVTFKYDPFGRRIYKSSSAGTSVYAYDESDLVEETNASGTVVARYSQGLNIDQPLAMLRSGATSYYHQDGINSVTSISNASGVLAQTYTFDSFGNLTNSSGSLTNPFRYTAREFDSETGLYNYRHRYYDPSIGRFTSEDLIRFESDGPNLYWYVKNRATNLTDPLGLQPYWCQICFEGGMAASDMWVNYKRMQDRNWKGDDLYYHCQANCWATNEGKVGAVTAKVISFFRTGVYGRLTEDDWRDDDRANKCGQKGGDCNKLCAPFIPKSSPGKPPFPGW